MDKTEKKEVGDVQRSLNDISASFRALKMIVMFTVGVGFLAAVVCVYLVSEHDSMMRSSIYVLDNGAAFSATARPSSVTRVDEVRNHVQVFHDLFFNLPPDMTMITRNLERALVLSDKSAYDYYENLREKGFYKNLVNADAYQQIVVDSIKIDITSYPYRALTFCSQFITRRSNMSRFSLVTRCNLVNVPRSANNLNGLMIEEFEVLENRQLEVRNKN